MGWTRTVNEEESASSVPVSKPAPLLSFNTASLRQSELVHGVRTETEHYNYNIKMKKMLVM